MTADILSRVRISDVYHALTARQPHRTGRDTWRAVAAWRDGDGLNVSGDDSRGIWHDFVTDEGGGVLDLIVRVRGGNRQDALRWLAEFVGEPLEDRPLTAAERAEWAARQREIERHLPAARHWKRAVVLLTEEVLDGLKAALFAPDMEIPDPREIRDIEALLARLRQRDGAALVDEYRDWATSHPRLTEALARVGAAREAAERAMVLAYLESGGEAAA